MLRFDDDDENSGRETVLDVIQAIDCQVLILCLLENVHRDYQAPTENLIVRRLSGKELIVRPFLNTFLARSHPIATAQVSVTGENLSTTPC